jgi:hypothetical protein
VHRLDAPVSTMAKASYGNAAGGMTPVRLYKDITGIALRFPEVTAHVA